MARVEKKTVDPADYDCRSCGACCTPEFNSPIYVGVSKSDLLRFTKRFRDQHVAHRSILTKLDPIGHCACVALRGTVGRRVSCGIYERRPDPCRQLEAGSDECLRARAQLDID